MSDGMKGRLTIVFVFALVAGAPCAWAQVPTTVDPSGGGQAAPPPSQPAAQQPVEPIFVPLPGQGQQPAGAEDSGFYYLPEGMEADSTFSGGPPGGAVPLVHEVRSGDTLWDICFYYFNNPWEWPRIWSYNADITNPHWIYPGDQVRLYPAGEEPVEADLQGSLEQQLGADVQVGGATNTPLTRTPVSMRGVRLRQLAFVDEDTRQQAATVAGAVDEKSLLATGDSIYLSYPADRPLEVGDRYSVYNETSPVAHPETGKPVGSFVRVLGELEVVSVAKGKRARAVITDSVDVIERGARVGPLPRTFRTVEPTRAEADVQGTIVATLGSDALIGQGQVVFIDQGEAAGVKVGNRMYVVRRGDAYSDVMTPGKSMGIDDRRFPDRAIGEILIVQVGKRASAALVTLGLQEIGVGERVLMVEAR